MIDDFRKKKRQQLWVDIARNDPLFARFEKFMAGCGKSICFRHDVWVDPSPLKDCFLDMYAFSFKKETTVFDCWDNNNHVGDLGLRSGLFDREMDGWACLVEKLNSIQLGWCGSRSLVP